MNKGQKILLRLRYPGDKTQFLPIEQVTDTMLHELSHIVHGPHDAKFHALWDQLRDEHEGLVMKGYTGEGFLSKGHKLGGTSRSVAPQEARRLARAAAEQRARQAEQYRGSGQRLGGAPLQRGEDIRRVITSAVERRNAIDKGCGSTNYTDREIQTIADTATKNGFRTQAEEDAANEAAIAQALWELVQEDEKKMHGDKYIPPSAEFPAGSGGGALHPDSRSRQNTRVPPPVPEWSRPGAPSSSATPTPERAESAPKNTSDPLAPLPSIGWTCDVCTLHNPPDFLSCDACGSERSVTAAKQLLAQQQKERTAKRPRPTTTSTNTTSRQTRSYTGSDLAHSRMVSFRNSNSEASSRPTAAEPTGPAFWECSRCGNVVERQWWSCAQCGNVKESSA